MSNNQQKTLEELFKERREYWMSWTDRFASMLNDIQNIPTLQSEIYARRQEAVENRYSLSAAIATKTKEFNVKQSSLYSKLRLMKIPNTPNYMYSSDSAIRQQIDGELAEDKYVIQVIDNHVQFLDETIKTIDEINFSIQNRIRVQEIIIGK
jgi:molybdopterin converting factor small subunit